MNTSTQHKPIQILELFGGIGAPRAAMRNIGVPIKSIDYVEIDEKAVRSYNAIFRDDLGHKQQDVRGWNLKPDILIHGSPCQDFSIAGHQKGADEGSETRSSLMWETINIIKNMGVWKPRVVIWENVKNVLSKHMRRNFDRYIAELDAMGYESAWRVLNTKDYGLPQNRERVYTVSILGGPAFDFDAMQKRPMRPLSDFLEKKFQPQHIVKAPSMLSMIGKENKKPNFNGYLKEITDCADTITCAQDRCPNAGVIRLADGTHRYLTERECWRLQGYSDEDYEAAAKANPGRAGYKNTALYKQAGNSMSVPVLEQIYTELKPYLVTQPSILGCIGHKGIRRATVIQDCAHTITCRQDRTPAQVVEMAPGTFRYLTEKECLLLQGFEEKDYEAMAEAMGKQPDKMQRDLYKQAGNSMSVPVLEEMFRALRD